MYSSYSTEQRKAIMAFRAQNHTSASQTENTDYKDPYRKLTDLEKTMLNRRGEMMVMAITLK